jgi:UDP-glucose 4-epimerase
VRISAIIHFAESIVVTDSVTNPLGYNQQHGELPRPD